jgi:hypothetical protein
MHRSGMAPRTHRDLASNTWTPQPDQEALGASAHLYASYHFLYCC